MVETMIELVKDTQVRIVGDRGTYKVMSTELNADGSVTLFGGDMDPGGRQSFRAVMPERLVSDKRKRRK